MLVYLALVAACIAITVPSSFDDENNLTVTLPMGKLRGHILHDKNGRAFYAFQKVPFAQPPVGPLRFRPAQKREPWQGVLDASQIAPDCPQDANDRYAEDCLYLNVYTHRNANLCPVMVYVYGGALTGGSINPITIAGGQYLLTQDVVLVTFNYRVGLLGFLSWEDGDEYARDYISANNGFKDQVFALQWIQDHIHRFGGDPHRVTVFGNSAGAISVHLLLLSPLTKNLFHRAIIQSGTALTRGIAAYNNALLVAKHLGLDASNSSKVIAHLRNMSVHDILSLQDELDIYRLTINTRVLFGLVIESNRTASFMRHNPLQILQDGAYHRRPVIMGMVDAEGLGFYVYRFLMNTMRYYDIDAFVPYYYKQRDFAALLIDQDYFPTQNYTDLRVWIRVWSYSSFIFDIVRCVQFMSAWHTVYFYQFEVDSTLNWSKKRAAPSARIPGACHGDELGYLFAMNRLPKVVRGSFADTTIDRMVTMWSNFATFGQPIIGSAQLFENTTWLPVQADATHFVRIGRNITSGRYDHDRIRYWSQLYNIFSTREL